MKPGEAALMLLPGKSYSYPYLAAFLSDAFQVGLGVSLALVVCFWYDRFLDKAKARGKTWAFREEYRRLPLVCVGGPLNAASQFWLVSMGLTRWSHT